jgi:hypothetical protein
LTRTGVKRCLRLMAGASSQAMVIPAICALLFF